MPLRCCVRLLLILWFALPLLAQDAQDSGKPATTLKTQVRRVLVDVVVTDTKGDAVTGLKQKDFEVVEDGKPQTIATFEEHHGTEPREIKLSDQRLDSRYRRGRSAQFAQFQPEQDRQCFRVRCNFATDRNGDPTNREDGRFPVAGAADQPR